MNKGTGQIQKRVLYIFLGVAVGGATFFIYEKRGEARKEETVSKILNQGLNEYIDPSQAPIYNQEYVILEYEAKISKDKQDKLEQALPKATDERLEIQVQYTDNSLGKLTDKSNKKEIKSISLNLDKNKRQELEAKKTEYGIKKVTATANKELMDIIYPSRESIDKLNREIIEERQQIVEYEKQLQAEISQQVSLQAKIKNFLQGNQVKALKLSNDVNHLVISMPIII